MFRKFMLHMPALLAAGEFVWREHVTEVLVTALLSMVPTFEGRYAITIMLGKLHMPLGFAYPLAVICSTLPMPFIFLFLRPVLDWFYTLPIPPVRRFAAWLERRSARKREQMHAGKRSGVRGWLGRWLNEETLELIGLYIFVALPLPGTGCWTGSAIATLFEMPRGRAALAIFLGNVTACALMSAGALGVISIVGLAH